ncbi:acyloxyacyl hydrolase [Desulfatiglans anilini]|uniref:acyloxyacyl hydrolase n=1 Tax=Desulfatiglans anilini TaxID=90728 RepID=UPI0004059887|nr:acyloxyacyl hydrolase [Desulfatiglans anilini]
MQTPKYGKEAKVRKMGVVCNRKKAWIVIAFMLPLMAGAGQSRAMELCAGDAAFDAPFRKGQVALQLASGLLFSPTMLAKRSSVMDYWQTNLRLSKMLTKPGPDRSLLRGNWELIGELTYSYIYKGAGNVMGGITGLIRYNFVQPGARCFPYLQAGVGVVLNDAYRDGNQIDLGQAVEFTPQGSAGLRFMLSPHWALNGEVMFHHVSNAGLSMRNRGLNAFGGLVGMTYFFGGTGEPVR